MSHHFDNPNARDDPRLNVNDLYLFPAGPERTVMAMTVSPDAGLSAPDTLRDEGLYAIRFDTNGDAVEEVTFKFRFEAPGHADGDEHRHVQAYEVRRATGSAALHGLEGTVIAKGMTGETVAGPGGAKVWVGLAPDLFAGDAAALARWKTAFYDHGQFDAEAWQNHQNYFARRNVVAIVLEVPNAMIGHGKVRAWATSSLVGHAPEVQVCRWGWPLFTHIFMLPDMALSEQFNRGVPADDRKAFGAHVLDVGARMATYAKLAGDPVAFGHQLAERLLPSMLPYELGTPASFGFAEINGRALTDDVMDVNLTQASNFPLADGVAPDHTRVRPDFPYFGAPYTAAEQTGVAPAAKNPRRADS